MNIDWQEFKKRCPKAKHFVLDGAHVSCDKLPSDETVKALRALIAAVKSKYQKP